MPNRHSPIVFVGSTPFDSAVDTFEALAGTVGDLTPSFPDGDQAGWLLGVWNTFPSTPTLEHAGDLPLVLRDGKGGVPIPTFRIVNDADHLDFDDFGFADTAIDSFRDFKSMRDAGTIPAGVRFQVALPSPLTAVSPIYGPIDVLMQGMETAMAREVRRILDAIPHEDLLISWDLPCEVEYEEMLRHPERSTPAYRTAGGPIGGWTMDEAAESIDRVIQLAPAEVMIGIHLCYGDPDGRHIIEPADASVLTEFANVIFGHLDRRVDWLHMPIPISRDDAAYFEPLGDLDLPAETSAALGLLHHEDGIAGAQRRIERAVQVLPRFGLGSECGLGRAYDAESVIPFLELHREAGDLLSS